MPDFVSSFQEVKDNQPAPIEAERDVLLCAAERDDVDEKFVERSVGRLGVKLK